MFNISKIKNIISDYFGEITKISDMSKPNILKYKGVTVDASAFYCPYIPLQHVNITDHDTNDPIKFKTRYGLHP